MAWEKKAQAFTWLIVMATLFGMALLYIVLNEGVEKIKPIVEANFTGTRYNTTYQKVNTIWDMWLFIALFGIIIWGILSALRRKDEQIY